MPDSEGAGDPKLIHHIIDFDRLEQVAWPRCEVLFCCVGTTIKAAGSKAAFRTVDFDYVIDSARYARQTGASSLILVSALGADVKSNMFYNRIKGEMEAAVATLGFESVSILRPSLLEGKRVAPCVGERFALAASRIINPILPARYRPVPARSVARAMIVIGKTKNSRNRRHRIRTDYVFQITQKNLP